MAKNGQRGTTLKAMREKPPRVKQFILAEALGVSPAYLSMMESEHGGWGLPRGFAAAYVGALRRLRCEPCETTEAADRAARAEADNGG